MTEVAPRAEPTKITNDVVHVITSSQRRGAEVFAVDLAERLRTAPGTHPVVALAAGAPSAPQLPVEVLGSRALSPTTVAALRRRVDGGLAVAHGSTTLPASALSGRPFVYRSIGDPTAWAASGLRKLRVGVALRRARAVVALWPGAADSLRRLHRIERVEVIPNAADADRFRPATDDERSEARAALGLPADAPVVACIGALSEEKRVDRAIEAVTHVPDAHLVIAGAGPERPRLDAAAGRQVTFLGSVDDPRTVLAACDVVVLTSRTEGMPGVLVEAGLSGLPTVATAVGGVPEIVDDGQTGLLVDADATPGEVAAAVERAVAERRTLGAAARDRCAVRFSFGAVLPTWRSLLDQHRP